jgi:DNA ligase-1
MNQVDIDGTQWTVHHSTPLLMDKASTGKNKYWQGFVASHLMAVVTYTEYWQEGAKQQRSVPVETVGKNLGKANETTALDQAKSEIDSQAERKQKKGYKLKDAPAPTAMAVHQERMLPMLALSAVYPKRGHSIKWPCYVQPKLDGKRCVTNGVEFWSREGNLQPKGCVAHLQHNTEGMLVDGELMLPHDKFSFQESMSACMDPMNPNVAQLLFFVFDLADKTLPFDERWDKLQQFLKEHPHKSWVQVATLQVATEAEAYQFYGTCTEEGFEGVMLRNSAGRYRPQYRSPDIQKLKPVDDDEFEIVGYKEASGKDAGTPVWRCKIGSQQTAASDGTTGRIGAEFDARPMGSIEHRRKLWKDRDKLIGKFVTVKFQGYYDQKVTDKDAGKPRFPRAKGVRTEK